jgi:capsular polysaccharide transport system permease protein
MMVDFARALKIQGRVLLALMLREARTRYGRRRAGYLWALIEPLVHITLFYYIFKFRLRYVPLGDSLLVFMATGFLVFLGFRNVMNRTMGGYSSNEALLSFPIVNLMDVFLGRALLELTTWIVVLMLLFSGIVFLADARAPYSILKMLMAIICLFSIGFGVGVSLGILMEFLPSVRTFFAIPNRILYWISGIFFLPDAMPPSLRDIMAWNPILHGITLFREGYYRGYESNMLDIRYLATWAIGCILVAFVMEIVARKPIRNLI